MRFSPSSTRDSIVTIDVLTEPDDLNTGSSMVPSSVHRSNSVYKRFSSDSLDMYSITFEDLVMEDAELERRISKIPLSPPSKLSKRRSESYLYDVESYEPPKLSLLVRIKVLLSSCLPLYER